MAPSVELGPDVAPERVVLAHDPQTSGGLLAAVPPEDLAALRRALESAGVQSWEIGRAEASTAPGVALA